MPPEIIDELVELFTEVLGPLAPKLAKKQAKSVGISLEYVPAKFWPDLLNTLAERIDDETKQHRFLDRAVLLKKKF